MPPQVSFAVTRHEIPVSRLAAGQQAQWLTILSALATSSSLVAVSRRSPSDTTCVAPTCRSQSWDDGRAPGGAWQHTWASLRLFSPAQWSSLPGRLTSGGTAYYPTRDEALACLADYETRYALPVLGPSRFSRVEVAGERLRVITDAGAWIARAAVSATGTWSAPNVPRLPDDDRFAGRLTHSAHHGSPTEFAGQRVVVVVGGARLTGSRCVERYFQSSFDMARLGLEIGTYGSRVRDRAARTRNDRGAKRCLRSGRHAPMSSVQPR